MIDVVADRQLGHVCEPCLRQRFGWTVTDPTWQRESGCAVCERDAWYVLEVPTKPTDFEAVRADGGAATDADLGLCDEHFHALLADRNADHVGRRDGAPQGPRAPPDRR
ncbi:hypothetical protein ACKVMT_02390 [Halobacteriales archaeon Cl-PHB]